MITLAQAEALFWLCAALLFYTWLGYPALLFLLERCLYAPIRKRSVEPTVSILLCAYNEEETIAAKIENLLTLDYPEEKLEIAVASDGSQDATAAIARRYGDRHVRVIEFPLRRGKPSVINDAVPQLRGEIVLLVDARQRLERDLLRRLVPNFADKTVGGVSGELALERPEQPGIAADLDFYWRYEKWLRFREAGIDSTLGGTGAVFAFRRALFQPLPSETILDDVALPLRIIRQGLRVVMEPGALAWDRAEADWAREFTRKARTLAGNFQVLFSPFALGLGSRFLGLIGFEYFSHKILRLFGPALVTLLAYANWRLVQKPEPPLIFAAAWRLQEMFYLLALAGGLLGKSLPIRLLTLPASFLLMQVAVVAGFLRFAASRDNALWEKPQRLDAAEAERRILRLFLDSSLFSVGMVLAFFIRYLGRPPAAALQSYMQLLPSGDFFGVAIAAPFFVMLIPAAVFYFFRLHEAAADKMAPEHALGLIKGVFYSSLILFLVIYIRRSAVLLAVPSADGAAIASMPTSVMGIGFFLNCALVIGWRFLIRERRPINAKRPLLICGEKTAAASARSLPPAVSLVRFFDQRPENWRERLAAAFGEGGGKLSELLVDVSAMPADAVLEAVAFADSRGVPVRLLSSDLEIILARAHPRLVSYLPLVDLKCGEPGELYAFSKRTIEILLAAAGLALAPFLGAILLLKRWRWRLRLAAVERVANNGQICRLWRLRHTEGLPLLWVRAAQLCLVAWHLGRGDLSLVGLPPLSRRAYERLGHGVRRFLRCRPGVFYLSRTTLAENARGRRTAAMIYYSRHRSAALDLRILLHGLKKALGACFAGRRRLW